MQTNFENKVKEKLRDFKLKPSEQVWDDISLAISKNKKRRLIVWGGLPAAILLTGSVFGFHAYFSSRKITKSFNTSKTTSIDQGGTSIHSFVFTANNTSKPNAENKTKVLPENEGVSASSGNLYTLTHDHINLSGTMPQLKQSANNSVFYINLQKNLNYNSSVVNTANLENTNRNLSAIDLSKSENTIKISLLLNPKIQSKQALLPATGSSTVNFVSKKIPQQKKSNWSILIAGGTTNTVNKNSLFKSDKNIIYTPAGSNTSDTLKTMKQAYTGFHTTIGIQYSDRLSPKWTLYAGMQYSFLLNHQRTGKKVVEESEISQTIDTSYSLLKSFVKIPYHYPDGTSANNTNYASWIELPVGIGYTINPLANTQVEIRAGGSVAEMFGERWLVADGRYNKFYYSRELTNNIIVNWHADAFITFPKQRKIGLQLQHSITSFAKKPVQPANYWSNISLYTTFPLR